MSDERTRGAQFIKYNLQNKGDQARIDRAICLYFSNTSQTFKEFFIIEVPPPPDPPSSNDNTLPLYGGSLGKS